MIRAFTATATLLLLDLIKRLAHVASLVAAIQDLVHDFPAGLANFLHLSRAVCSSGYGESCEVGVSDLYLRFMVVRLPPAFGCPTPFGHLDLFGSGHMEQPDYFGT